MRRYSSLVEHQLPKLGRRVRFPLSASRQKSRKTAGDIAESAVFRLFSMLLLQEKEVCGETF